MGMVTTEASDQVTTEADDALQTNEPASVAFDVATGITILDVTVLSPTSMIVDIDIAGSAPATARDVTVTTRIGTSDPLTFTVTAAAFPIRTTMMSQAVNRSAVH